MAKVHLRANKIDQGQAPLARCATQKGRTSDMLRTNSRQTYRFMASEIVGLEDFKATPAELRCAHCMDNGLIARNRQRREKGLPPVDHLFA